MGKIAGTKREVIKVEKDSVLILILSVLFSPYLTLNIANWKRGDAFFKIFILFIWLHCILVVAHAHDQRWNLGPLHREHGVLATGPPGKSPEAIHFGLINILRTHNHKTWDFHYHKFCLGTSLAVQWLESALQLHGAWVQSLVEELRSCLPHSMARKNKIEK